MTDLRTTLLQTALVSACLLAGAAHAAGNHTAAQFAVTESGAATLTVPIQVPRGIGGMEPQLALNYSTGAGNGLLGLGWSLSGPSAITRCPKTILHDGVRGAVTFGVGDRFCLDGQRLMPSNRGNTDAEYGTTGAQYRTDKDTFSRITASTLPGATAPASFKVETKSGLIMEFGISANSQVLVNDPAILTNRAINRWMLQRISDRNGSFVEFVYCKGEVNETGTTCTSATESTWSGSTVLHYIRYTNRNTSTLDGTSAVVFGYQARPDKVPQFHYGAKTVQTQRMSRIDTYVGFALSATPGTVTPGTLVRRYALNYEQATAGNPRATTASRLISLQESDGGANVLPPLEITLTRDLVLRKGWAATSLVDGTRDVSCGGTSAPGTPQHQCP